METQGSAFAESVVHYREGGKNESVWSRGICRGLQLHNFDEVPYPTSQLLEPSALTEVAREAGVEQGVLETLNYDSTGPVSTLRWLYQLLETTTDVQRVNLAACLSSTMRYRAAKSALDLVDKQKLTAEQELALHMNTFIVNNRLGLAASYDSEFAQIQALASASKLSDSQLLDASAQAIVWHIKSRGIRAELYDWFIDRGTRAAKNLEHAADFREMISLSCFYRAFAMVPAEKGDVEQTRLLMQKARDFAWAAEPKSPSTECTALDAKKTVIESSLKESLYLRKDLDEAKHFGAELIAFDPNWSISYHEVAEVYLKLGDLNEAMKLYNSALDIGLPRRTVSQYMIGCCLEATGCIGDAILAFEKTLVMDPSNISAAISGFRAARTTTHRSEKLFAGFLERWDAAGLLNTEHRELLK